MSNLLFDPTLIPIEKKSFELVERKGMGHPDTLADGAAEAISIAFSVAVSLSLIYSSEENVSKKINNE